jgi:hypothetical protein
MGDRNGNGLPLLAAVKASRFRSQRLAAEFALSRRTKARPHDVGSEEEPLAASRSAVCRLVRRPVGVSFGAIRGVRHVYCCASRYVNHRDLPLRDTGGHDFLRESGDDA